MPVPLPVAEDLGEAKLTEEQLKAIEETKAVDWDKPKDPAKAEPAKEAAKPEKEDVRHEEKPAEKTAEELEAESKAKEEEKAKLEAEEKETARLEKKAKELGKKPEEVKQLEADEKADNERVEKLAKEEGISVDDVRENELKDRSVADRHGKDPFKLARALRKEQSEYGKLKNEVEQLRDLKAKIEESQIRYSEERFETQMAKGRDDIIAKYREKYADETAELSDDAVFERGKAIIKEALKAQDAQKTEKNKTEAVKRRDEIIKSISDEFKDYIPEVKDMLKDITDAQVLDKGFDVNYLATYARGRKVTSDYIKSLEEAAYKRGVEQAKIIPKVLPAKPTAVKVDSGKGSELSQTEKTRAEEIYGRRDGWSKEKMWDEYAKSDKGKDF